MSDRFFPRDEYFMRLALREAEHALEHEDVPIGAVVVRDGEVIGAGHNEREAAPGPHRARGAARAARGRPRGRQLAGAGHGAVRDARAVRDVRGGDRAGAGPARGVRRARPQGGGGGQRARRAGRAPPEPPPRGRGRAAGGRSAGRCSASSSPRGGSCPHPRGSISLGGDSREPVPGTPLPGGSMPESI